MKATLSLIEEVNYFDGSTQSIVIWKLPEPTKQRPHGYKYRLNYHTVDGDTIIRYDNSHGKSDHKHIGNKIYPYEFTSVEKLLDDFRHDIRKFWESKQDG